MSAAQQLLIAYGVGVLGYGLLLGIPLAAARAKAVVAPRYLLSTHLSALMQGPIHLGLAAAVGSTGFDSTTGTVAAWLLIAGSAMEALGGTVNWLTSVDDQFAERSIGYRLNSLSAPVAIAGLFMLGAGIVTRL